MSPAKRPDDAIYAACITWNLPLLRGLDREDARHFIRTVQLLQNTLRDASDSPPTRMTPLRRAAEGLKAELTGDSETARSLYTQVAKNPGVRGVLGSLLLAWMSDASEVDFDRAERKLRTVSGQGSREVIARGHCKLALWAFDHGWSDRSQHHFAEAKRYAGKALSLKLDEVGHWFGADRILLIGGPSDDLISYPWITDWVDKSAKTFVEKQFIESFKSPWTRTWSFGSSSVEGVDIQSAELQASWAGAIWLLPAIQRQHAALIMAKSEDPSDVSRAIALWAKGGGRSTNQLVSTKEAFLSEATVVDLLENQLHEGRSVHDQDTWMDICHSLWAEMPDRLVRNFVLRYDGPPADLRPRGHGADELGLFGKLLVRSPLAIERAASFNERQLGMLARETWPQLLPDLPQHLLQKLLASGLAEQIQEDEEWRVTGWASLIKTWSLLDEPHRSEYREQLLDAVPAGSISDGALLAPDLFPKSVLADTLTVAIQQLESEVRNAAGGMFHGWGTEPAIAAARLALALDVRDTGLAGALVDLATSRHTSPGQRLSGLEALTSLAEANLVTRTQVREAFRPIAVNSVMSNDASLDQRLEDVTRLALQVHFRYDQETSEGPLLAASRDRSTQVRLKAVGTMCKLSLRGESSPSLDATLLGALYDPHPRVQTEAIPALWRGTFNSETLRDVAQARVIELWPIAHRELRVTIAQEAALADPTDARIRKILEWASEDRSWAVRRSATRD